jgi:hypothetical protein
LDFETGRGEPVLIAATGKMFSQGRVQGQDRTILEEHALKTA